MFGALSSLKDTFSDTFLTEFLSSLSNRTITLLPNIIFLYARYDITLKAAI